MNYFITSKDLAFYVEEGGQCRSSFPLALLTICFHVKELEENMQ